MADRCKALNAAGALAHHRTNERHRQGQRCLDPALPGDALCWTHRATVTLGAASERQVLEGRRPKRRG